MADHIGRVGLHGVLLLVIAVCACCRVHTTRVVYVLGAILQISYIDSTYSPILLRCNVRLIVSLLLMLSCGACEVLFECYYIEIELPVA